MEFAILTVRLGAFDLVILGALNMESVEGVFNLMLETSDGAEIDISSGMVSGKEGIETGMGRSIDKRDATEGKGIGMFNDSLRGLMG